MLFDGSNGNLTHYSVEFHVLTTCKKREKERKSVRPILCYKFRLSLKHFASPLV